MVIKKSSGFGINEENGQFYSVELDARQKVISITETFVNSDRTTDSKTRVGKLSDVVSYALLKTTAEDFNERLKNMKLPRGKYGTNTLIERILGKELCVLAWALELAQDDDVAGICARWLALIPHERWWLYSMVVAETGLAKNMGEGWRAALYYALSGNTK